jgi:probable biosynthetic protein (TIGR04098 family)
MPPYLYDLRLGMPHTNYWGLSEPLLLMQAAHFHWASIASAIGEPLSRLRTASGGEVYAAFYYVEERIPACAPLESFGVDDVVRFSVSLRSFKNIAVEGSIRFDLLSRFAGSEPDPHDVRPQIRFGNIFITPVKGNSLLNVAAPVNGDFSGLRPLPNDENPYHLTRAAAESGSLGVFDSSWTPIGCPVEHRYQIDVDRDTNGAGLVYFANYVWFMERAERLAGSDAAVHRSLRHRRIAYYGNADVSDTLLVRAQPLRCEKAGEHIGFRYSIARETDGRTICVSEAIKALSA